MSAKCNEFRAGTYLGSNERGIWTCFARERGRLGHRIGDRGEVERETVRAVRKGRGYKVTYITFPVYGPIRS